MTAGWRDVQRRQGSNVGRLERCATIAEQEGDTVMEVEITSTAIDVLRFFNSSILARQRVSLIPTR